MVKIEGIPTSEPFPEYPWFHVRESRGKQESAIREYALHEGFLNLRGYASHLKSIGWDYYDVLRQVSP